MLNRLDEQTGEAKNVHSQLKYAKPDLAAKILEELNQKLEAGSIDEILQWGFGCFGKKMVIGTGFGLSGMVILDRIQKLNLPITVFYLDTKQLFPETYQLKEKIRERFQVTIEAVYSELTLNEQAEQFGDNLWNRDPDKCCYLRKISPLKNFLAEKKAWVTGVRRSQADTRKQTEIIEWDPENQVVKINPLAEWSEDEVWSYIEKQNLPYNPLHDRGYPTIGCVPCTEPADTGTEQRSGRWKNLDKTECGIHIPSQKFNNGRA